MESPTIMSLGLVTEAGNTDASLLDELSEEADSPAVEAPVVTVFDSGEAMLEPSTAVGSEAGLVVFAEASLVVISVTTWEVERAVDVSSVEPAAVLVAAEFPDAVDEPGAALSEALEPPEVVVAEEDESLAMAVSPVPPGEQPNAQIPKPRDKRAQRG